MSDPWLQELPAEWLDHLVLDMTELEALAARLEQSLGAIRSTEVREGPLSVQILDVLARVSDTTGTLHELAKGRLMSLATTNSLSRPIIISGSASTLRSSKMLPS